MALISIYKQQTQAAAATTSGINETIVVLQAYKAQKKVQGRPLFHTTEPKSQTGLKAY